MLAHGRVLHMYDIRVLYMYDVLYIYDIRVLYMYDVYICMIYVRATHKLYEQSYDLCVVRAYACARA